jgi:hypothetical protein
VRIGYDPYFGGYLNGHIDEFRVSKGIARYTPQLTAYTVDSYTKLLLREYSGSVSKRTLPDGHIYEYDLLGVLTKLTNPDNSYILYDAYWTGTDKPKTSRLFLSTGTLSETDEYFDPRLAQDLSQNHTLQYIGDSKVDTTQYQVTGYSQASTCLDGNGDYVLVPDSDDFNFGTGDFTIDTWVKFSSTSDLQTLYSQNDVGGNFIWFYYYGPSQQIGFRARKNSVYVSSYNTPALTLSPGSWHHIALVRTGGHIHVYMDGIDTGGTEGAVIGNTDLGNIPAPVRIGYDPYFGGYLNGHIDEFRVSKGIARYTPQTTAYTVDSYTKLLLRESSGAISKRTLSTGTISIYDLSGNLKSG